MDVSYGSHRHGERDPVRDQMWAPHRGISDMRGTENQGEQGDRYDNGAWNLRRKEDVLAEREFNPGREAQAEVTRCRDCH